MGRKGFSGPQKPVRRRFGWRIALILLVLLLGLIGWMFLQARIVHVRYAEVYVDDLPTGFDGVRALYASDIDLCGAHSASDAAKMFDRLQALNPDLLLLGGDYTSSGLLDRINGFDDVDAVERTLFFKALADFRAPMGKFAISGDNDGNADALRLALKDTGIALIDGLIQPLVNGDQKVALVGAGAGIDDLSPLSVQIRSDQCAIVLAHSPEQVVDIRVAEASDGGAWADLVLSGHTQGGQVNIAGRSALRLTDVEKRYLNGWYTDASAPLLVSSGVGCEAMNLRFDSQAEVWLITLRSGQRPVELPDL